MSSTLVGSPATSLTLSDLKGFEAEFRSQPANLQAMNAVSAAPITTVGVDRDVAARIDHSFSHHLPENAATAQKSSGRCWLFAALNTFRTRAIASMNLTETFELSQAHICFYDKLEKANYFLTNIIETVDEPVGSRVLDHLLANPIEDGGQWHMFINVVQKYGVVPKTVMPETDSSSNTRHMNAQITGRLREFAWKLRSAHEGGSSVEELHKMRTEQMAQVYRMLCIHLGVPPQEFDWQWRDKDKKFTRAGRMTPQTFYQKYVGLDVDDMVCLIHDPRPGHDFDRLYTVKYLGNVVGGAPVAYVNVDLETMKKAAIEQIKDGSPVWFGCDVGKYLHRDLGMMDTDLFALDLLYGSDIDLPKAERLMYRQSMMTHAMVFTGVDIDDGGSPRKWRVENSWSEEAGDKGFFQMTDKWFDEYNLEVVVEKRHVPESVAAVLQQEAVVLEPWDPMGSLA
ncbi:MAG TPA: C1 family peptidase [Fimbriimonadaceae bacterium]|nr:C1 family peptidase [Fimbriimonadaceae bacterium]